MLRIQSHSKFQPLLKYEIDDQNKSEYEKIGFLDHWRCRKEKWQCGNCGWMDGRGGELYRTIGKRVQWCYIERSWSSRSTTPRPALFLCSDWHMLDHTHTHTLRRPLCPIPSSLLYGGSSPLCLSRRPAVFRNRVVSIATVTQTNKSAS